MSLHDASSLSLDFSPDLDVSRVDEAVEVRRSQRAARPCASQRASSLRTRRRSTATRGSAAPAQDDGAAARLALVALASPCRAFFSSGRTCEIESCNT